jgi:hypothetical protein
MPFNPPISLSWKGCVDMEPIHAYGHKNDSEARRAMSRE